MINETHHYLVCQLVGGSLFSLFSGLRIIIVIRIHQTYICIEGLVFESKVSSYRLRCGWALDALVELEVGSNFHRFAPTNGGSC